MKPETDDLRAPRLAEDSDGCLFDERARELVSSAEGAAGLEAIAAVRVAAHHLHRRFTPDELVQLRHLALKLLINARKLTKD